jgi:tetratricopeptide (TPR) repeat protein
MNKKLVLTIKAIAVLLLAAPLSYASGKKDTVPAGTVSLDHAITNCTEELKANVSGKTEIVIAAIKAPDNKTADFLTAELTTQLMRSGSFTVLERGDALKAVDAEQEFQMSGLVSDDSAVGIGHYLGAKVVVTGTFEPYNGFSQLRLRAVDVRTSQILAMPSSRINPRDNILAGVMPQNIKPQTIKVETLDHLSRGKDLIRENKYDEAIREFNEAIRLEPKNAEAYRSRGRVYSNKKDYTAALADYNTAISFNSKNAEYYFDRFYLYSESLKDKDKALADITQAINLKPTAFYYSSRGLLYRNERKVELAITDLAQAIRLDPNEYYSYSVRATLYHYDIKNYDLAIADYTQVIKLAIKARDKTDLWVSYKGRGALYEDKNDHDRAIADFNEAIKINPNDRWAYNSRGGAYLAKKDYTRAIADYEAALKLDPDLASAKRGLEEARKARGN